MSEILLQAIIEKLETLEIALLRQDKTGKNEEPSHELATTVKSVPSELMKFSSIFNQENETINNLSEEMHALRLKLGNPIKIKLNIPIISISRYGCPLAFF